LPKNPLFRPGPGLKALNTFFKFFDKGKPAVRDFPIHALEASPAAIVVRSYCGVVQPAEPAPSLLSMPEAPM
jgi:hypothetical protein